MPTSRFTVSTKYTPRSGDYLCLPFLDAKTRAGELLKLPRWITELRPHKSKGGARTEDTLLVTKDGARSLSKFPIINY